MIILPLYNKQFLQFESLSPQVGNRVDVYESVVGYRVLYQVILCLVMLLVVGGFSHAQEVGSRLQTTSIAGDSCALNSMAIRKQIALLTPVPTIDPVMIPYYWTMDCGFQFGRSPGFVVPLFLSVGTDGGPDPRAQFQGYHIDIGVRVHADAIASLPDYGSILKATLQYQTFAEDYSLRNISVVDNKGMPYVVDGNGTVKTSRIIGGFDLTAFVNLSRIGCYRTFIEFGISTERELFRSQEANVQILIGSQDSIVGGLRDLYDRNCHCIEIASQDYSFKVGVAGVVGFFHQVNVRVLNKYFKFTPFIRYKHGIDKPMGAINAERSLMLGIGMILPMGYHVTYPQD